MFFLSSRDVLGNGRVNSVFFVYGYILIYFKGMFFRVFEEFCLRSSLVRRLGFG